MRFWVPVLHLASVLFGQSNLLSIQSSNSDGINLSYAYDELGRRATAANGVYQPPMVTTYSYNTVGNLEGVSQNCTWHHNETPGITELVNKNAHAGWHRGGVFYWEVVTGKDYK